MVSGKTDSDNSGAPKNIISEPKIGRNEIVVVVKDGEEKEMKYKKAEPLIEEGWQIKK